MNTTATRPLCVGEATYLRALLPSDEERFLEAVHASRGLHHPWVTPASAPDAFRAYLARVDETFKVALVGRTDDDALVGVFNLSQIAMGRFKSAYVGFQGFAQTTRQGLMREGTSLFLHWAFLVVGLHRVEANIQPENTRSTRLVSGCGFEREGYSPDYLFLNGEWRDHERWAIRREIWEPSESVFVQPE